MRRFGLASVIKLVGPRCLKFSPPVITSKHHDGFSIWGSAVTDYDVMDASPFKRDILGELKAAADRQGIRLGLYHSIMDWHHPDAQSIKYPNYNSRDISNPEFPRYVENYLKPQVAEFVEKYDPAILWFDGEWVPEWTHEMGMDMYNFVRNLKPDIHSGQHVITASTRAARAWQA